MWQINKCVVVFESENSNTSSGYDRTSQNVNYTGSLLFSSVPVRGDGYCLFLIFLFAGCVLVMFTKTVCIFDVIVKHFFGEKRIL